MTGILAIRPEPGLSSTLEAARGMGLELVGQPLLEIAPLAWDFPAPESIDALLIGSANAILHGGDHLEKFAGKPVYAVGQTTADAARKAGFSVVAVGVGGLQTVLDTISPPKRLLRITGAEHVPLDPPEGVLITKVIAYESRDLQMNTEVVSQLGARPLVLIHSAAAARHFATETDRLGLKRGDIGLAVLGPRIAEAAGSGWRSVHISAQPNDGALLEMARDICI